MKTKNVVQGYSALSVMTPGIEDPDALEASAERAADAVIDGDVSAAVRDAVSGGAPIRRGEFLARRRGTFIAAAETPEEAVLRFLESSDTDFCELLTLFAGKSVTPDRRVELTDRIQTLYPELGLTVREGGQDVYDYYIALE